jgi:hypothetical protein
MKRSIVLIGTLLLLASWTSAAVEQGDIDVDFNFRWSTEEGANGFADRDRFEIGFGVAKEITPRIQLGIAVGHEKAERGTEENTVNFYDLKLRYHILPDTQFVPYIGGIYRWYDLDVKSVNGNLSTSDTALGFLAGLRYELTERNDIYLEYQNLSYGNDWPLNFDGGSKVLMGLIHQIR